MPTLLLKLVGPMQSWGTMSRFDQRDTGNEPSKSGVLGILAAAMGIDRGNWSDLEPLTHLKMGVRHDRPGIPKKDFQTAGCAASDTIIRADGTQAKDGGVISHRDYLADAAFLVALEGGNPTLLEKINASLRNPVWSLFLGRKSYIPSEPVWCDQGIHTEGMRDLLAAYPWISHLRGFERSEPLTLRISLESQDGSGSMRMDQLLSSFVERRFGARFVSSEEISFPKEVADVAVSTPA
ncbi:MAG: type I-E CRISPR-associated protein Cas5/CasD [Lentisphaeria bacterium]